MIPNTLLLLYTASHLVSIALYLRAYFPTKSLLSGASSLDDLPMEPHGEDNETLKNELLSPVVGRTVIILIDALRADFIFDKEHVGEMPFVQSMLSSGQGIGFVAKAHPPTVTLPRIKVSCFDTKVVIYSFFKTTLGNARRFFL